MAGKSTAEGGRHENVKFDLQAGVTETQDERPDTTVCGGSYKITQTGSLSLGITHPQIGHFAGIFRNPITFVVALQLLS